jgi:hypothetical protein
VAGVGACTTPSGAAGGQLSGYGLNNVPKFSANLYANHSMTVLEDYTLNVGGTYSYRGAVRARPADTLTESPGYGQVGLNASISPANQAWHLGFYAKNLLNTINPQVDASGQGGYYVNYPTRDNLRSIGVTLAAAF